jgi:hypothetical protein
VENLRFDLGVTAEQVVSHLQQFPLLSIVGFQRSGKSTLAEMLAEDLGDLGYRVFMQNASNWLHSRSDAFPQQSQARASVDPEIVAVTTRLEGHNVKSCWIVDDAEVMLAYATEGILRTLGEKIRHHRFSMVLIRNRFVFEEAGWFQKRQALISPNIPKLAMRPLQGEYAIKAAISMFQGRSRVWQGKWLASMSGGIPGLMSDLHRYTPGGPGQETTLHLERFARRKRQTLDLDKPFRRLIITALERQVLPPVALLSEQAKTELGALTLSGMVSPHYAVEEHPYQGEFWELASGQRNAPESIPNAFQDIGLNLEIMIREANLADVFCQQCEIALDDDGLLGQSFASCLYCWEYLPTLIRPLQAFFIESLGGFGLAHILKNQGVPYENTASPAMLADKLFRQARSR